MESKTKSLPIASTEGIETLKRIVLLCLFFRIEWIVTRIEFGTFF